MALWVMGDLHLSKSVDKPMYVFGSAWYKHEEKIEKNCRKLIKPEDTLVLTGDHSWGHDLEQCAEDLRFIEELPGRKILLRGNHDMFWDVPKTEKLNELFQGRLSFLQNNFFTYREYALVGTKGYCFEGKDSYEHYEKIMKREKQRLELSFAKAKKAGYRKFIMLLHYPPTSIGEQESVFTNIAKENGASFVIYSHSHGEERFHDSIQGLCDGSTYCLVSSDFLKFRPVKILD